MICAFTCLTKAHGIINSCSLCTCAVFICAWRSDEWRCQDMNSIVYPVVRSCSLCFPNWTFGCHDHHTPVCIYFPMAHQSFGKLPTCFSGSIEIQRESQFNALVGQEMHSSMFLFFFACSGLGRVEKGSLNPVRFSELSKQGLLTQTSLNSQILSIIF